MSPFCVQIAPVWAVRSAPECFGFVPKPSRAKRKSKKIKIKEEREKTGRTQRKETTQDYKGHG
jgi:hypothetical protein